MVLRALAYFASRSTSRYRNVSVAIGAVFLREAWNRWRLEPTDARLPVFEAVEKQLLLLPLSE